MKLFNIFKRVSEIEKMNDRMMEVILEKDNQIRDLQKQLDGYQCTDGCTLMFRNVRRPGRSCGLGYNYTTSWHSDYPDESIDKIIHGFYTCLIGATWLPQTVIDAMRDYVDEHTEVDYESTEN